MASAKRNQNDFKEYEGYINPVSNCYEFKTLYSFDSKKNVRLWRIKCEIIKSGNTPAKEQNWNTIAEDQLPMKMEYILNTNSLPVCECRYWIEQGLISGKITRYPPTYTERKNVLKKNERNELQQALLEMRSRYLDRLESGAKLSVEELSEKVVKSDDNIYYWPMLATKFKEEYQEIKYPAYAQIKMNGIRMLSYLGHNEVVTHTRDLKEIPGIPQIKEELIPYLKDLYVTEQKVSFRIDGELFAFNTPLNLISGWARNPAVNSNPQIEGENVRYFIFDCFNPIMSQAFEKRLQILDSYFSDKNAEKRSFPINIDKARLMAEAEYEKALKEFKKSSGIETKGNRTEEQEFLRDSYPYDSFLEWKNVIETISDKVIQHKSFDFELVGNIALVPTLKVASKSELICLYHAAVLNGFEGLMVRNAAGEYATSNELKTSKNRSKDLQKLKPVYDDEFEIHGYTSGKGRNQNAIIWICKTKTGNLFNCDPKDMTIEKRKELFMEFEKNPMKFKKEYQGLMMTVQYEEKNNDSDIPQRAKALGIRTFG
jgi:ATP-dependent DNA ligase